MKNALYVSLTVLSLVGCGKLNQVAPSVTDTDTTRYAAAVSNRTLVKASDDISASVGDIYSKFEDINNLCVSTEAAINEFNDNLVAAQASLGPLLLLLESNRAFVAPFQSSIDAMNIEIGTKQGQVAGYDNTLLDLNDPASYQAKVKDRRKFLRNALNTARRNFNQAMRDLRQAKAGTQRFTDAQVAVGVAKNAIAYYKGQLSVVRETITGQVNAMKTEVSGYRTTAMNDITRLQSEITAFSNIIKPYLSAIASQEAQVAAIPTVEGLKPYVLPSVCEAVSK